MDDPWGSPWADEVQLPPTIKPAEKKGVEIGPTTPARAASLSLQEKTNSPWDDIADDSFGDWAPLPNDDGRGLGLDGQLDEWENNDPAEEISTSQTTSDAFSLDWNEHGTREDPDMNHAPNAFLEVANPVRLPSPDPWATSFTTNKETKEQVPGVFEPELQNIHESQDEQEKEALSATDAVPELHNEIVLPDEKATDTEVGDIESATNSMELGEVEAVSSPVVSEAAILADNSDGGPPSSRRSSSPSEHSQSGEMAQESPRTSFDEEPNRPQVRRVVSSKVQELVEHFDGLAKQDIGDTAASSTSSGQETIKAVEEPESEGDDDFGDFEEGQSDEEQEAVEDEQFPPDLRSKPDKDHRATQPTAKKFEGPVDFDIDTSLIESMFPNLERDTIHEKIFVPDMVPYDSFSTTEERKIWYRVSRYGTMRKHNTGDDDYVRINWQQSQIRKETLDTVARWMEEDRISGRVVLGGASKGSSIFGWNDKKVGPVPLAHAFASKPGKRKVEPVVEKIPEIPREWPQDLARKSSTSKGSPSRTSKRSSVKATESLPESKPLPETASIVEPPAANFGWNATPVKPRSPDKNPPPGHKSTGSMSSIATQQSRLASLPQRSLSVKQPSKPISENIISAPVRPSLNTSNLKLSTTNVPLGKGATSQAIPDLIDDEDDWGEMVASPVVNIGTAIPPAQPLPPQAKSGTELGNKLNTLNGGTTQQANHRAAPSSDEIFTPISAGMSTPAFNGTPHEGGSSKPPIAPAPSTMPTVDPWASADFSFFETTPAPAPAPPSKPSTRKQAQASTKSVSFHPSPLPPVRDSRKSREEVENDRIVQSVVKSLPDLSYMLRR